ncbi:hypothetical protein ES708_18750 [subsurface metagenome]
MNEAKSAEVQAWLRKASADLRAAEIDLGAQPPLIEDALFHCQQAVEKTLKAFLTARDSPFRKTHDLDELGRMCIEHDRSLENVLLSATYLTVFAWEFRYPGESTIPPLGEAVDARHMATRVYEAVMDKLRGEITESS